MEALIVSKQRSFLDKFISKNLHLDLPAPVRYILETRIAYTRKIGPRKKEIDQITWKIDFTHKILEDVNIQAIYNLSEIRQLLPTQIRGKDTFRKVFSYGRNIGSKILNYNQCLKEAQTYSLSDINNMSCDCAQSVLTDTHHNHIMTGNLDIVKNDRLRKLVSNGTRFREVPRLNIRSIKDKFENNVNDLIVKIVRKYKIPKDKLKDWKVSFLRKIFYKLDSLANIRQWDFPVLTRQDCRKELERLQKLYVITVVDKAAGNFAFTCKKFYYLRLAKELGLDNPTPGNVTYEYQASSESDVCKGLISELTRFKTKPDNLNMRLAMLYHNPKFHKNPIKFRFIAGNVKVVTSELDRLIASILKMCKGHFVNLCKKYESFSKVRYCFDIEKSSDLKANLDTFQGRADIISINDFATLYTLFEHDHLIRNITWLLDRLSKNSGCQAIKVTYTGAFWARNNTNPGTYSLTEVIEMVTFLIKNSFIKAFGKVFKQTKGIIMGGKSSGWLSDCSLMVDEFLYIDKLVKEGNHELARKFKGLNRYRDDCTALNIDNFMQLASNIYPQSLELSQENADLREATVLDMQVEIKENSFVTKVYNKTDSFPFHVVSLPFLASNIDQKICYKVFFSQILRYERLCSFSCDFEQRVKALGDVLISRGYDKAYLGREFEKVVGTYRQEFEKWKIPIDSKVWFTKILNPQINNLTLDSHTPSSIPIFSQPLPVTTSVRPNYLSQP